MLRRSDSMKSRTPTTCLNSKPCDRSLLLKNKTNHRPTWFGCVFGLEAKNSSSGSGSGDGGKSKTQEPGLERPKPSVRRATRSSEPPALPRRGPGKPARRQLLTDCVPARSPSAPGGPGLTSRPGTSSARLKADVCKCLGCARCQRSSGCSHQGLWRRFAVERLRWESSRSSIKYQVSRTLEWHSGQL